ncbi:glycosyltransferase family 2 protein [Metabacillus sp. 84]|uniref:glycosyltransferase family 2 protein n=1 Tax=Metabacillus sp. 84 TaxID=3404705 RepID=UPI003CE761BA
MKLDLSIIIPVFNLEDFLHECLETLINQKPTSVSYEVICVNDGSTDSSKHILDNFAQKYPKLIKVFHKNNSGVSSARNYGLKNSSGKYVTFVDGDDWVSENFVNALTESIDTDSDIAIFNTVHSFNEKEIIVDEKIDRLLFNTENHACGKTFKRELIEKYNLRFPEDVKIGEDLSFTFSYLLVIKKYMKINEPLYFYRRERVGSAMSNRTNKSYLDIFKACNYVLDFSRENNLFLLFCDEIEYVLIKNIIVRTFPKIVLKEFPNYFILKKYIRLQFNYMEKNFPNWEKNKYYQLDVEKYFIGKLGKRYRLIIRGLSKGKLYYIILIMNHIILTKILQSGNSEKIQS